jgi:hypothetical protein
VAFSKGIEDFEQIWRCREDSFSRVESWIALETEQAGT